MQQVTCKYCGKLFERSSFLGPEPKYCSNSHRDKAYKLRQKANYKSLLEDVAEFIEAAERVRNRVKNPNSNYSAFDALLDLIPNRPSSPFGILESRPDVRKHMGR